MNAVWRWLFIYTGLGRIMNNNTYCHCGKYEFAPKWDTPRGFFLWPLPLSAAAEQELMFCWFQKGWKIKGGRSSPYVSFLSIRHWRGLCTITSHLNILKNTSWERGCSKPLPALWCIAELCCSPLGVVWIQLPGELSLPAATRPRGSRAGCDSSRYLIPLFSSIITSQRPWKARLERLTATPHPQNAEEGWQTTKGFLLLRLPQLMQCHRLMELQPVWWSLSHRAKY